MTITAQFADFTSGGLPSWLTAMTAGSGTVTVDTANSELKLTLTGASDGAAVRFTDPIDPTQDLIVRLVVRHAQATTPDFRANLLARSSAPIIDTVANYAAATQFRLATAALASGKRAYAIDKWDTGGTRTQWDRTTNAWTAPTVGFLDPITAGDYHEFIFEVNGSTQSCRWLSRGNHDSSNSSYTDVQGYKWRAITDWVALSSLRSAGGNPYYLVLGWPHNASGAAGTIAIESISVETGTRDYFLYNGRDITGSDYSIYAGYRLGSAKRGVPLQRAAWIAPSGSTTENTKVQWQTLLLDDDGTYVCYYSAKGSTGSGIHAATWTSWTGSVTKQGRLVAPAAGPSLSACNYPFIVKDGMDTDATKRYKLFFAGVDSVTSKYSIYVATASSRLGTFTVNSTALLVPNASAGQWDSQHVASPVVFWETDHVEMWFGGNGGGGSGDWSVGRATATTFNGPFTKDGAGARIAAKQNQIQALSANLGGRTASMTDTTGFFPGQLVVIDQDSTTSNYSISRVRNVTTNTSLELFHGVMGFTTANSATVFGISAGSMTPCDVRRRNGQWEIVVAPFNVTTQHGTISALMETSALWVTSSLTVNPTESYADADIVGLYAGGSGTTTHSAENLTFVQFPIIGGTVTSSSKGQVGSTGSIAAGGAATDAGGVSVDSLGAIVVNEVADVSGIGSVDATGTEAESGSAASSGVGSSAGAGAAEATSTPVVRHRRGGGTAFGTALGTALVTPGRTPVKGSGSSSGRGMVAGYGFTESLPVYRPPRLQSVAGFATSGGQGHTFSMGGVSIRGMAEVAGRAGARIGGIVSVPDHLFARITGTARSSSGSTVRGEGWWEDEEVLFAEALLLMDT